MGGGVRNRVRIIAINNFDTQLNMKYAMFFNISLRRVASHSSAVLLAADGTEMLSYLDGARKSVRDVL